MKTQLKLRALLGLGVLLASAVAHAASGYTVTPLQEKSVRVGMSRDEVRQAVGRPAHNLKYRNEPGRTWTYGVANSESKVFDVDFSADGKVTSTSERIEDMD